MSLRLPLPRGVAGRMAVALVASLIVIHGVIFLYFAFGSGKSEDVPGQMHRVAAAVWFSTDCRARTA
ncbi:hypothetical protein [Breoghania sp.]|uniref:hypothetical protein n=1 Tax=Breoghania sp. TaxID=2065378 RepID=UPI00260A8D4E|nr:hypothetical protein [Breoghania sp.]MDJ0929931.1 hypothetical protein [Breoghania sp.]